MANLAVKVADLDEAVSFFERHGAEVRDRMFWNNAERADVFLGPVMITLFTRAIYEDSVELPPEGFLHPALFTDDLEAELEGHEVLWGPHVVEGTFGKRRIAFVDAPGGIRLEFMEQLDLPPRDPERQRLVPEEDIGRVAGAQTRLLEALDGLVDEDLGRPSLLPGWSVAHVLSHLARNADSHVRRVEAGIRGEVVDQYEGGPDRRNADIEAGSSRSGAELVEDVRRSARAVEESWVDLPEHAWTARSRDANGRERFLFELPSRRWQEVEVHLVDLDIGVGWRSWPDEFVREWLPRTREKMWAHMPGGSEAAGLGFDLPADELAWLYGRLHREDLPELPSWG